ncbi:PLP-dependent aminotransferase family protein [Mucilaginibacter sp. SP1R1]|uniref:aminotransferase-like domain-containing protein n=1 Tax=Mucilaginibacter sp. SP1R1 TaxID=2723091 RepID=UPI003AFF72F0
MKEPAYIKLANEIAGMIETGIYKPGDKLPSLRSIHKEKGLSIGTLLLAFNNLIDRGLLNSREKSGYFVSHRTGKKLPVPLHLPVSLSERTVHIDNLLRQLRIDGKGKNFVTFANALPDNRLLPFNSIKRAIQNTSRDISGIYLAFEERKGNRLLREEIAKRSFLWKGSTHPDELVITNGATEAVNCCLRAVTKAGDTVLVQDPCYYGVMQTLECLDLKMVTIPSHPETGIEIADLEEACKKLNIKACILVSNFNNPDGACLSTEKRNKLQHLPKKCRYLLLRMTYTENCFLKVAGPIPLKLMIAKAG